MLQIFQTEFFHGTWIQFCLHLINYFPIIRLLIIIYYLFVKVE